MNKWVKDSFKLASSRGYLDKLSDIYPVDTTVRREVDKKAENDIARVFRSDNKTEKESEEADFV